MPNTHPPKPRTTAGESIVVDVAMAVAPRRCGLRRAAPHVPRSQARVHDAHARSRHGPSPAPRRGQSSAAFATPAARAPPRRRRRRRCSRHRPDVAATPATVPPCPSRALPTSPRSRPALPPRTYAICATRSSASTRSTPAVPTRPTCPVQPRHRSLCATTQVRRGRRAPRTHGITVLRLRTGRAPSPASSSEPDALMPIVVAV